MCVKVRRKAGFVMSLQVSGPSPPSVKIALESNRLAGWKMLPQDGIGDKR
jgi:hypothetical protein